MVLNLKAVLGSLGSLVFFLGIALLAPVFVAILYSEPAGWSFAATAAIACIVGGGMWRSFGRRSSDVRAREGFAIVALAWIVLSLVGALPYLLSGTLDSYTDAFFETMSGFTTTGATIFGGANSPAIEELPRAFLLWRSLTHWLGGMGIIVLTLAILPILGVGGMQLFRAEVPGPSTDKLTPRIHATAQRLWIIYVGFTLIEVMLLLPVMGGFDAINHAMSTMATGGFSTYDTSVAAFGSAYVDWVIIVFMFLAGINFALHYRMFTGRTVTVLRDTEFRVYSAIILAAIALVTLALWEDTARWIPRGDVQPEMGYASFSDSLRYGAFQVLAIITTTGFATVDYQLWPVLGSGVIFLLFFCGGMAGSTGGGVKILRHVLMFKNSFKEIKQLIHPQAMIPIRLNGEVVSADVMRNVLSFLVLYIGLIGLGTAVMSLLGLDLLSAFSASMSSVGNIGPAFGTLGPADNYAHIPMAGKWVLSFLMVAGRLEIFTVLILFVPAFWKH